MAYPLLRFAPHPIAVISHVIGQSLRAFPGSIAIMFRIHRVPRRKFWWQFDEGFGNQNSNWIKVGAVSTKTKTLCLKWDGTAATEWIINWGCFLLQIRKYPLWVGFVGRL